MSRVLLFNAWHDDNKGDCAILHATLDMARKRWPHAELSVHTLVGADDPAYRTAFRHAHSAPVPFAALPSLAPMYPTGGGAGPARSAKWMLGSARFLNQQPSSLRRQVRGADAVILVGGSNVFDSGRHRPAGEARLLRVLAPARAALAEGVPTYLLGHTLGPFSTGYSQRLVRQLGVAGATFVLREAISVRRAQELGLPEQAIRLLPDVAFLTEPVVDQPVTEILRGAGITGRQRYAVLVPRTHPYDDAEGSRSARLATEMAALADQLIARGEVHQVLILAQCLGPTEVEDDRWIARRVLDQCRSDRVSVVSTDLAPRQLAGLYGGAELVVGVRLHAVILAMAGGAPVFAIDYFTDKTQGILEMARLSDGWCRYDDFRADHLLARWAELSDAGRRTQIQQTVTDLRNQLLGWAEVTS